MLMRKSTFLFTAMLMIFFTNVNASHPLQFKEVNGIAIYLTIMPAEMLRGHPKDHLESEMHTETRIEGTNQHHIAVSLFNAKNGNRLQNAIINAKVSSNHFKSPFRKLELMVMGGTQNYGNYFSTPLTGTYQVELEIQTEGEGKVTNVIFQYASI